jgi:hypothetical protein
MSISDLGEHARASRDGDFDSMIAMDRWKAFVLLWEILD